MKRDWTVKTAIISLCAVIGLSVGVGSAFATQMLSDDVKGEVPLDRPQTNKQQSDLVPEHLKPKEDKATEEKPKVKGEKPPDRHPSNLDRRQQLVPERPNVDPEQKTDSSQEDSSQQQKEQQAKERQEQEQQQKEQQAKERQEQEQQQKEQQAKQRQEQEQQQKEQQAKERQEQEQQQNEQQAKQRQEQQKQQQDTFSGEVVEKHAKPWQLAEDEEKSEEEIAVSEIFGMFNRSESKVKDELQQYAENLKKKDSWSAQQKSELKSQASQEDDKQQGSMLDEDQPPRTVKNGQLPMTASNDLNHVLMGCLIAITGILYISLRKVEL